MEDSQTEKSVIEKVLETKTASRAQQLMQSKSGTALLGMISFFESFLPIPIVTDPFLAAAIMVDRKKTLFFILWTTAFSVVGGFFAYLSALFFRDLLLVTLTPNMLNALQSFIEGNSQDTFVLTILGAVTPVPYTIIAYAIALTHGNPMVFILGSIVGRLFRYGIVGWCTYKFGPLALAYAKRSILITSVIIFAAVALYIWKHVS